MTNDGTRKTTTKEQVTQFPSTTATNNSSKVGQLEQKQISKQQQQQYYSSSLQSLNSSTCSFNDDDGDDGVEHQQSTTFSIQQFISDVNKLDPNKHFNPASNLTSNPTSRKTKRNSNRLGAFQISGLNDDSLQGINFSTQEDETRNGNGQLKDNDQELTDRTKQQLSNSITPYFSQFDNLTFGSGLAHLALIGQRIMQHASIETTTNTTTTTLPALLSPTSPPTSPIPHLFISPPQESSTNEEEHDEMIVKSGYLMKERTKHHSTTNDQLVLLDDEDNNGQKQQFATRFVVLLKSNELKYYSKKKNQKHTNKRLLKGIIHLEDSYITVVSNSNSNLSFKIHTPEKLHTFKAQNEEEMQHWIETLCKHGSSFQNTSSTTTRSHTGKAAANASESTNEIVLEDLTVGAGTTSTDKEQTKPIQFKNRINKYYNYYLNSSKSRTTEADEEETPKTSSVMHESTTATTDDKKQVVTTSKQSSSRFIVREDLLKSTLERKKSLSRFNNTSNISINNLSTLSHNNNDNNHDISTISSIGDVDNENHLQLPTTKTTGGTSSNGNGGGANRYRASKSEANLSSQQLFMPFQLALSLKPGETPQPPQPIIIPSSTSSSLLLNISIPQQVDKDDEFASTSAAELMIDDEIHPIVEEDEELLIDDIQQLGIEPIEKYIPTNVVEQPEQQPLVEKEQDEFISTIIVEDLTVTQHDTGKLIQQPTTTTTIETLEQEEEIVEEPEETEEQDHIHSYNMSNPQSTFHYTSYPLIPNLNPAIVIDNGSGTLKAGFSNQDFPTCVFNNMIGRLKSQQHRRQSLMGYSNNRNHTTHSTAGAVGNDADGDLYFGDGAQAMRGLLNLSYPVERGIVKNFNDFELILQYICQSDDLLQGLESFSEHPILLTESSMNPKQNRERTTQIMFETFDTPYLYMGKSSVFSLFANGRVTGMVLDSGDGVTSTIPIYEGYSLPHAVKRLELAGRDLTSYLMELLNQSGQFKYKSSSAMEIVKCLKEDLCSVKSNSNNNLNSNTGTPPPVVNYDLPDGSIISVGEERFKCPELLFNPSLLGGNGSEMLGVHQLCQQTIVNCDIDLRKVLASNIYLSGGSTKFTGFQARLQDEVQQLLPHSNRVKVRSSNDVQFLPWIGGSIVSKIARFPHDCISRLEYEEMGPQYCHVKFM